MAQAQQPLLFNVYNRPGQSLAGEWHYIVDPYENGYYNYRYQAWLYEETLQMLGRTENLRGFTPWVLMDFRSPRLPLPEIQDGWNRKGAGFGERGEENGVFCAEEVIKEDP